MSRLIQSIELEIAAARNLVRACARHGAITDSLDAEKPMAAELSRSYRATHLTPMDMLSALSRINK